MDWVAGELSAMNLGDKRLDQAVFGLTFVALDPDGHRIRICIRD